jgi:hypothetical protein
MIKEKKDIIDIAIDAGLNAKEIISCIGVNHIEQGYISNEGRGRCIRKDGTFDYLKMSELVHSKQW